MIDQRETICRQNRRAGRFRGIRAAWSRLRVKSCSPPHIRGQAQRSCVSPLADARAHFFRAKCSNTSNESLRIHRRACRMHRRIGPSSSYHVGFRAGLQDAFLAGHPRLIERSARFTAPQASMAEMAIEEIRYLAERVLVSGHRSSNWYCACDWPS